MDTETQVTFVTNTYGWCYYNDAKAKLPGFRAVSQLFRALSAMVNLSMLSRSELLKIGEAAPSIMERKVSQ